MCGIVGYTGSQEAAPILLEGLKKPEYSGYDSAGKAVLNGDLIAVSKVTGRIANLCERTDNGKNCPGTVGIGHTRIVSLADDIDLYTENRDDFHGSSGNCSVTAACVLRRQGKLLRYRQAEKSCKIGYGRVIGWKE